MPDDADIRVLSQVTQPKVGENLIRPPIATRDGALFSADWYLKQLLRGRIFQVQAGATDQGLTDPGTWGAGTLDDTEFDLILSIPANVIVVPLSWEVVMEKFGSTQLLEIVLAWGTLGVPSATNLTLVPVNKNTTATRTSALTNNVVANANASGTALTMEGEIFRDGLQLVEDIAANDDAAWPSRFVWRADSPSDLYIIEGVRQIAGYIAAQGGTGFQRFTWAEFESGEDIG